LVLVLETSNYVAHTTVIRDTRNVTDTSMENLHVSAGDKIAFRSVLFSAGSKPQNPIISLYTKIDAGAELVNTTENWPGQLNVTPDSPPP